MGPLTVWAVRKTVSMRFGYFHPEAVPGCRRDIWTIRDSGRPAGSVQVVGARMGDLVGVAQIFQDHTYRAVAPLHRPRPAWCDR